MMAQFFIVAVMAVALLGVVSAINDPRRHSKTQEIQLPMSDGTYLHTLIYFPRDYETDSATKLPTVMDRSPYGYGDMEWITDLFLPYGFVAVGQDMRGTEKSEGNFSMWQSDASDSTDLGNWITHQEWSNGEVYTFGVSADGLGAFQTLKAGNSWLTAQYLGWCPAKMYDILFPGGCYKQKTTEDWLHGVTMPIPSVVDDNIQTVHENEMDNDFWAAIQLYEADYAHVTGRSGFWAGWYDLFLTGTLEAFDGYNTKSDPSVRGSALLTIDACGHCLEAGPYFTQNAVQGRTLLALGQLLETYGIKDELRGRREYLVKNITFYVMSSNDTAGLDVGQYWTSMEVFPKPKLTDFFFHADGSAQLNAPADTEEAVSTSYKSDPADPVPTRGGNNLPDSIGGSIPCGPWDQSPLDTRTDILSFTTPVQATSEPLYLTGPMTATLFVSSDAIDTDFMVKISDLFPNGEARLIMDSAIRMRWREHTLTPVYMATGVVYEVTVNLWNTSYVVAPGHALKFAVMSSNFPRFSVNANNGLLLADVNYPGANITATNTLFHSAAYPSRISLPVVDKSDLPEIDVLHESRKKWPHLTDEMVAKATAHFDSWAMGKKKN